MESLEKINIYEIPGVCWPTAFYPELCIDRSPTTVRSYLQDLGLHWVREADDSSVWLRKAELSQEHISSAQAEINFRTMVQDKPNLLLIGEPQSLAPQSYKMAEPDTTLAVAPADKFDRMYFCAEWKDPQLESWHKRQNRICWIGRPIADRIRLAQILIDRGYPLDIYSRQAWPVSAWRGPAEDDVLTAANYKYRIVLENSRSGLYHSEKLFTSMRSGCVTFYLADSALRLPSLDGCFLELNDVNLQSREDFAPSVIEQMNRFLFSSDWEIYSPKSFYDRIKRKAQAALHSDSFSPTKVTDMNATHERK